MIKKYRGGWERPWPKYFSQSPNRVFFTNSGPAELQKGRDCSRICVKKVFGEKSGKVKRVKRVEIVKKYCPGGRKVQKVSALILFSPLRPGHGRQSAPFFRRRGLVPAEKTPGHAASGTVFQAGVCSQRSLPRMFVNGARRQWYRSSRGRIHCRPETTRQRSGW